MISVEMAKSLIDHNFFHAKKGEKETLLKEKLIQFVRMYAEKGDKNPVEGKEFSVHLTKDGLVYNQRVGYSQEYRNIGANENGWDWSYITGPNSSSEFYYNGTFGNHSSTYFEFAYAIYFSLFRSMTEDEADKTIHQIMACKTDEETKTLFENKISDYYELEEIIEDIKWNCQESLADELLDINDSLKMVILCSYYIFHYINGTVMDENLLMKMNDVFCNLLPYEKVNAEEYMDCFLSELEDNINCSMEGKREVMDLLLNVYFSFAQNSHGTTPTLFIFKSSPLLEYKKLKQKCGDSPLIDYIDRLVPMLEDPAFMFPGDELDYFVLDPEVCVVNHAYTEYEYICAYYYYDSSPETEIVKYDNAFSLARKCFEVLLEELRRVCNHHL